MRSASRARSFDAMVRALLDLATASPWAYLGLAAIAALDVLVLVLPSESAVISAGVLAAAGDLDLALVVGSVLDGRTALRGAAEIAADLLVAPTV
jgi:membrane protein DedA with SNARE-associated domain